MRFLIYAVVALAIALTSLVSLASMTEGNVVADGWRVTQVPGALVTVPAVLHTDAGPLLELAQVRIPDPTQEQVDSARGFAMWREKVEFNRALFGLANIPRNCTLGLLDESKPPSRFNYVLDCDGPITWCDAPGVECDAP